VRTIAQIDAELARLKAEKRALKPVVSLSPGFKRSRSFRPEGEGQRQPRERDNGHLAYIRRLPCAACGRPGPSDAAHVRTADPARAKRQTGMAEKPSDRWTVPLCRPCHERQHSGSEAAFWSALGIDVIALCARLYADSTAGLAGPRDTQEKT